MTPYARRIDKLQPQIVAALRQAGVTVWVTSAAGKGVPDLFLGANPGVTIPAEIKSPRSIHKKSKESGGYTPEQIKLRVGWRGSPILELNDPEQAVSVVLAEARRLGNGI